MQDAVIMTRMVTERALNCHGHLFGGLIMKWMDEVAFIAATRYTRKKMVTSSVEKCKFLLPVPPGSLIEISGRAVASSGAKLHVVCEVTVEEMYGKTKERAAESHFYFACIDDQDHPVRIQPIE